MSINNHSGAKEAFTLLSLQFGRVTLGVAPERANRVPGVAPGDETEPLNVSFEAKHLKSSNEFAVELTDGTYVLWSSVGRIESEGAVGTFPCDPPHHFAPTAADAPWLAEPVEELAPRLEPDPVTNFPSLSRKDPKWLTN